MAKKQKTLTEMEFSGRKSGQRIWPQKDKDQAVAEYEDNPNHTAQEQMDAASEVNNDEDKYKVEILEKGTVLNHHHLKAGTIVELTAGEIEIMRERGIRLGPVDQDTDKKVYDHTQDAPEVTEEKPLQLVGGPE